MSIAEYVKQKKGTRTLSEANPEPIEVINNYITSLPI